MMPSPDPFAVELHRFHAYYLATRPAVRDLDPELVRRVCAETLLVAHQRGDAPISEDER